MGARRGECMVACLLPPCTSQDRPDATEGGNDVLPIAKCSDKARGSCRGVAQLVEHRSPKPRATGSNPVTPAISFILGVPQPRPGLRPRRGSFAALRAPAGGRSALRRLWRRTCTDNQSRKSTGKRVGARLGFVQALAPHWQFLATSRSKPVNQPSAPNFCSGNASMFRACDTGVMRRHKHGKIRPMHEPGLIERLLLR